MKTSIKKLPDSKIEILIEISSSDFDCYYKKAMETLGKDVEIKGFRKGHVPSKILEEEMNPEMILNQAAQEAVKENYVQAVLDNNLEVIEKPEVEIMKLSLGNPFVFKAVTTVLPEIKLPDYKKIIASVEKKDFSVKDEDIEKVIKNIQISRAQLIALNRNAQEGDFVEIEYRSSSIEGGEKKQDAFVLGKGNFTVGFEENLKGMEIGEEKEFIVTMPKDHFSKDLAGKEVGFKVKMVAISEMKLPEVNDDFAKSLGKFENLVSLKNNIKEGLKMEKERETKEKFRQEIVEKIVDSFDCKIPQSLIEAEKDRLLEDLKRNLSQNFQVSFEEYLKKVKKTEEETKESLLESAQKNIKIFLTLREIAKKENVKVSEGEINQQINEILKNYPDAKTAQKNLDLEGLKEYTKERITNEKVFQLLEKKSEV